jgi:hypothetical protein
MLLSVYSVTVALTDQTSNSSLVEAAEADCGLVPGSNRWDNQRIIVQPGHRSETTETRDVRVYSGDDAPLLKDMSMVMLHVKPGGSYTASYQPRADKPSR